MKRLLIDADSMLYRAGFSAQKTMYNVLEFIKWDPIVVGTFDKKGLSSFLTELPADHTYQIETFAQAAPEQEAIWNLIRQCSFIEDKFPDHKPVYFLTQGKNFRYDIYSEYKANRVSEKPVHYQALFDYLRDKYKARVCTSIEADDALRIEYEDGDVLCHIDKDLNQIAGRHFNYTKNEEYEITEIEGLRNFYSQILTGDDSDNIPGIKGIGPKKAEKALAECTNAVEMYDVCRNLYEKNGLTLNEMHRNAKLLHLLRWEDDVWQPPT